MVQKPPLERGRERETVSPLPVELLVLCKKNKDLEKAIKIEI